jgi:hypothetical protein
MARRSAKRAFRVEILERREVLSTPTADQQYTLWLVNLARQHPSEAADVVTQNLDSTTQATITQYNQTMGSDTVSQAKATLSGMTPAPPLAWNDTLAAAASFQSQDQVNQGVESHNSSIGNLSSRLGPDHFNYANSVNVAEDAYAYAESPMNAMQAFLIDWGVADRGHRRNIMQPNVSAGQQFANAGVGIVQTSQNSMGPDVVTIDFGRQSNSQTQLLGVVYHDPNNSGIFTEGSGIGGVNINARNLSTGQVSSTQTWDAGGYQMPLSSGTYQVTATQGGRTLGSQQVTVSNANVEADFAVNSASTTVSQPVTPPASSSPVTVSIPTIDSISNLTSPKFSVTLTSTGASNSGGSNSTATPNVLTINPLNPALPVTPSLASPSVVTIPPAATSSNPPVVNNTPPAVSNAPAATSSTTTTAPTTTSSNTSNSSNSTTNANSAPSVATSAAPSSAAPASTTPVIAGTSSTPLPSANWFASWRSWSVVQNS